MDGHPKNIPYTTPEGKACRERKRHDQTFIKKSTKRYVPEEKEANPFYCANRNGVSIVCTIKEKLGKAGDFTVGKITLNYTFHNPNSVEDTAEMLLKLFIEAGKPKVEEAIKNAMEDSNQTVSHPA